MALLRFIQIASGKQIVKRIFLLSVSGCCFFVGVIVSGLKEHLTDLCQTIQKTLNLYVHMNNQKKTVDQHCDNRCDQCGQYAVSHSIQCIELKGLHGQCGTADIGNGSNVPGCGVNKQVQNRCNEDSGR